LAVVLGLLGGCMNQVLPMREVDARTFQKTYDLPRDSLNYWRYDGVKGKYAYLVHYELPATTDAVRKVERLRCPVADLPAGFPTKKQAPILTDIPRI
jgi:hypothetical protein